MLTQFDFICILLNFDIIVIDDCLDRKIIDNFINDEDIREEKLESVSKADVSICVCVVAIVEYVRV